MNFSKYENDFVNACLSGDLDTVKSLLYDHEDDNLRNNNVEMAIAAGCLGGHMNIVDFSISKGAIDRYNGFYVEFLDDGLYEACKGGHMEIVLFLISKYGIYKPNWNDGLIGACKGGHKNIIKFIFSKTNLKRFNIKIAFLQACSNGHMDIVLFIISKTNIYFDWDLGLYHACLSGNLELIEFIISKGAAYNHNGFIHACLYGYIDVVKLFISRFGIYDIDYIIELLMKGENKDIIRLLISNGAVSKENYTNVFEIDIGMFSSVANSDLVDYVVNFL